MKTAIALTSYLVLLFSIFVGTARADIPHEIVAKYGFGVASRQPDAALDFGTGFTGINIGGAYLFPLNDMFQVGPNFGLISASNGAGSITNVNLLGMGRINLTKPFEEAFFAQLGLGLRFGTGNTQFIFDIGFGKRINILAKRLFLDPTLAIYKQGSLSVRFRLDLLSLSLTL